MKAIEVALVLLILVPAFVNFYTPIYNRANPTLAGMPFFYWFQILLLAICVIPYLAFTYIEKKRQTPPVLPSTKM